MDFRGSLYFTDECCAFHIHFQARGVLELRNTISFIGHMQWFLAPSAQRQNKNHSSLVWYMKVSAVQPSQAQCL